MRRLAALLTILPLAAFAMGTAASEPDPLGLYVGASVGRSDVRTDLSGELSGQEFDEHSTGWKAVVGVRPISLLGAELGYVDFGHPNGASTLVDGDAQYTSHANTLQRAPTLSGLIFLPVPVPMLDIYAKAGIARLKTSGSSSVSCSGLCPAVVVPPASFSRTATDFLYGAGVQVKLSAFAVRLEYERINDNHGDPDLLSAGVTWSF